jgi:YbbR domain-containing protein
MRKALRWVAANAPLMALALILASLSWVVAVEKNDPTIEQVFPQPVPITLAALPKGMLVVGDFKANAQFTVRAPASLWASLKVTDFTAIVDLSGLGAGAYQLPLKWELHRHPAWVTHVEPEYVFVELDFETANHVPVRVSVEGEPRLGYIQRPPIVTPTHVIVHGPASYVSRVAEAVVRARVQDATADVTGEFQPQPLDSQGQSVPYVMLETKTVSVQVPIQLSAYYRVLSVKAVLTGTLAPGYRITSISVEPPNVTVFGNPESIAALPGYIETRPVNLEGAQADVVERPPLNLPQNISLVMAEQPVVRVRVEAIQGSRTMVITPTIQGLGPGLTCTISPATIEIVMSGPMPLLDTLDVDDVRAVLDLFNLGVGVHQLEPHIVVPEGITAQSILPVNVQVEIVISSSPTPEGGRESMFSPEASAVNLA